MTNEEIDKIKKVLRDNIGSLNPDHQGFIRTVLNLFDKVDLVAVSNFVQESAGIAEPGDWKDFLLKLGKKIDGAIQKHAVSLEDLSRIAKQILDIIENPVEDIIVNLSKIRVLNEYLNGRTGKFPNVKAEPLSQEYVIGRYWYCIVLTSDGKNGIIVPHWNISSQKFGLSKLFYLFNCPADYRVRAGDIERFPETIYDQKKSWIISEKGIIKWNSSSAPPINPSSLAKELATNPKYVHALHIRTPDESGRSGFYNIPLKGKLMDNHEFETKYAKENLLKVKDNVSRYGGSTISVPSVKIFSDVGYDDRNNFFRARVDGRRLENYYCIAMDYLDNTYDDRGGKRYGYLVRYSLLIPLGDTNTILPQLKAEPEILIATFRAVYPEYDYSTRPDSPRQLEIDKSHVNFEDWQGDNPAGRTPPRIVLGEARTTQPPESPSSSSEYSKIVSINKTLHPQPIGSHVNAVRIQEGTPIESAQAIIKGANYVIWRILKLTDSTPARLIFISKLDKVTDFQSQISFGVDSWQLPGNCVISLYTSPDNVKEHIELADEVSVIIESPSTAPTPADDEARRRLERLIKDWIT